MGFRSKKVLERGVFLSPALGLDTPYELVEDSSQPDGLAVHCVESKEVFGTDVLAKPTQAQIGEQYNGFVREVAAWLVANNGDSARGEAAVVQVRQATAMDYALEDLNDDVGWVRENDLSARMNLLGRHLGEPQRRNLVSIAGTIAAANGLNETDARFIELMGAGLFVDSETVAGLVMAAMSGGQLAA